MSRPRRLYTVAIPVLWATVASVGFQYPGDEYGLWAAGALPGLWLPLLVGEGSPLRGFWVVLAGGIIVTGALGAVLDRLRAPWLPWYALWVISAGVLCAATLASYPSWARAMSKNGSFQAYAMSSLNVGLTFSTAAMIVSTAAYRAGRRLLIRVRRG